VSDLSEQLNKSRRSTYVVIVGLAMLAMLSQVAAFKASRDNRDLGMHIIAALDTARSDRARGLAMMGGVRDDLQNLLAEGRARSIQNRKDLHRLAHIAAATLTTTTAVVDSVREVLPKRKR
jgi:hypothetical protein